MAERVVTFGPGNGLVGVLTEPAAGVARAGAPAIVAFNVGINHHVGPYRLWVDLARALAQSGYSTLRFDLSGLGDSQPRKDLAVGLRRAQEDGVAALDMLSERRGIQRFVLVGLCSGVDSAHSVMLADPRVVGSVALDGYAFRTTRFFLKRWTLDLFQRRRWSVFAMRTVKRFTGAGRRRWRFGEPEEVFTREIPDPRRLSEDLHRLTARGVRMLCVYSGDLQFRYNYADQLFDMLPEGAALRGRIEVLRFVKADHVYMRLDERTRLIATLGQWVERHFPMGGPRGGNG